MIEGVYIFTKGGLVLWHYKLKASQHGELIDLLNSVIQTVFLEEKISVNQKSEAFMIKNLHVSYFNINSIQTEIVAFFSGNTEASYVKQVLKHLAKDFLIIAHQVLPTLNTATASSKGDANETSVQTRLWSSFSEDSLTQKITEHYHLIIERLDSKWDHENRPTFNKKKEPKKKQENHQSRKANEIKSKKEPTLWETQKVTKRAMSTLDLSRKEDLNQQNVPAQTQPEDQQVAKQVFQRTLHIKESCLSQDSEDSDNENKDIKKGSYYSISTFFHRIKDSVNYSFTGNKVLTEEDLESLMEDMKLQLLKKNVAADMVDQLIESVKAHLIGTRTTSFQSVKATVSEAFHNALRRILTQQCLTDVLKSVIQAKERSHVYSICFLGVNGVGKSTSLAKVAYYLRRKGNFRVLVSACDTFRAGAVEQLRTHTRNLGIELFEQGYGKDAALLCKSSLKYAQANNYDVVLIDTAGRMQDNEPLMRSLAKLVALNNPDLILFVAEALVGNDATHQLTKFNQCLIDFAPTYVDKPRGIDAVFLTKFDTVDSKVGAVLSLTYVSGCPIAFVGTGQGYTNIERLRVGSVVQALLSHD